MWNPETELVKRAVEIAKEEHPSGFNKAQLIASSKRVFGGFGSDVLKPYPVKKITTLEDVNNMGNAMAYIDGGYPVGMSGCYVVGINGGCGLDCPIYLEGECGEPQEFLPLEGADLEFYNDHYPS